MKIAVLNGSPKGEVSVTMQYVRYLEQQFPEHDFTELPVCKEINKLEKDTAAFEEVIDTVRHSDIVLWAFPLYVFLVHGNYKRFIELIHKQDAADAFAGKYAAALSTSIHFYDHTAHNYIRGIAEDMGMRYVSFYSAQMRDLFYADKQAALRHFFAGVLDAASSRRPAARMYTPLACDPPAYVPSDETFAPIDTQGKRVLVLADGLRSHANLRHMVERFTSFFTEAPEIVDIADIKMLGGCLGCIRCGLKNECAYDGKDDVRGIYEEKIGRADIVVFALAMIDRFFSARYKNFMDRRFFKTHQPQMTGKQAAYLIEGPISQEKNLEEIVRSYSEFDGAHLTDILSDEAHNADSLDAMLYDTAKRLAADAAAQYHPPITCRGVSAQKIFRDDIWGPLRFPFRADHKYYRKHGMYDFPQRNVKARLFAACMGGLCNLPPVRKSIEQNMKKHMVMPFQRVLNPGKKKSMHRADPQEALPS